jgi:hypothetical protein
MEPLFLMPLHFLGKIRNQFNIGAFFDVVLLFEFVIFRIPDSKSIIRTINVLIIAFLRWCDPLGILKPTSRGKGDREETNSS